MGTIIDELISINEQSLQLFGFDKRVEHMADASAAYADMAISLWEEGQANNAHVMMAAWAIYRVMLQDLKKYFDQKENNNAKDE